MLYLSQPIPSQDKEFSPIPENSYTLSCDKASKQSVQWQRQEIVESLPGQHVNIPNLHLLFESWPALTNPEISGLRLKVNETLVNLFPPGKRRSRLNAADPALFGAMWWPYASLERLCVATYLSIWLFAWDDETDSMEFSELATDIEEAQAFRADILRSVRKYLALDPENPDQSSPHAQSLTRRSIIDQFAPVGDAIVEHYTLEQRRALLRQLELFVDMSELEQRVALSGSLPSVDSYRYRCMGSSAVGVCLAIHEYTLDMRLPQDVVTSPAMQSLWDETNVIISVCNDILSLKKEIVQNQVDSLIPLLYVAHGLHAQAAIDEAAEIMRVSVTRFDLAANTLLNDHAADRTLTAELEKFIQSCRYAYTANLKWR